MKYLIYFLIVIIIFFASCVCSEKDIPKRKFERGDIVYPKRKGISDAYKMVVISYGIVSFRDDPPCVWQYEVDNGSYDHHYYEFELISKKKSELW